MIRGGLKASISAWVSERKKILAHMAFSASGRHVLPRTPEKKNSPPVSEGEKICWLQKRDKNPPPLPRPFNGRSPLQSHCVLHI